MRLITKSQQNFSLVKKLYDAVYINDPNFQGYKLAGHSTETQPSGITTTTFNSVESTYTSSKLANGITVLTESVSIPSTVGLGVFIDVGSRDQTPQTSGAMLLLKNVFLKTALNTNETVNYGIAQMSGGKFECKYDQESFFFRANCLSHDVVDVFSMMVDCATEPRNVVACSVGRNKNEQSHLIDAQNGGNLRFNDQLFSAAFGGKGLGNPTGGKRSNVANLSAQIIQKFQLAHITPEKIVISATGVQNHQQFVELVAEKFATTELGSSKNVREPTQYVGGQIRNQVDSSISHVAFGFEGASYADAYTLLVASEVLGHTAPSAFAKRNILDKNVFINNVQAFSHSFTDSGLFGLKLAGSSSHTNQIVKAGVEALSQLRNLSESDIEVAKASLKSRLGRRFTNAVKRNEQVTKSLYYLNETGDNYRAKIDAVSASSVNAAVAKAINSNLTLVIEGDNVASVPSYEKITSLLN